MIAALQVHFILAFAAFLAMFVSAVVIERNLRKMGRVGLEKVTGSVRNRQANSSGESAGLGSLGDRLRKRFKRDGDS